MNSNFYFLVLFTLILTSCGVKSDPIPPSGTMLPSIVDQYTSSSSDGKENIKEKDEKTAKKEKK